MGVEKLKVLLTTTPIRNTPTNFPPVACLSIKKALRKAGYKDVFFFDIDNLRPTEEQIVDTIKRYSPDVIGISAVVSTAYAFVKWLTAEIRRVSPSTQIVLGGNLAASADIVLRKTEVDYCVLSEGEVIFSNFLEAYERGARSKEDFSGIKGLVFIGKNGNLINTGYEEQMSKEEIYDFDWEDLEESSRIEHFFTYPETSPMWGFSESEVQSGNGTGNVQRPDGKTGLVVSHKGCVARCTFCHRWDKGVRYLPVDILIERIKYVIEKYGVQFVTLAGENFGSDRKWTEELCRKIKPLNVLWRVGGMRASTVTEEMIDFMKESGCVWISYGMETGSAKMLKVMEKKLDIDKNYKAMEWTINSGLYTAVQLVLGMPGETPETIKETFDFTKWACTLNSLQNPNSISINYAQALPGTPLYEFGRMRGLIGNTLDDEEDYLLDVSDKNASGTLDTLNFTNYPKMICDTWQPLIQIETNYAYIKKFGLKHYKKVVLGHAEYFKKKEGVNPYFQEPQRTMERIAQDSVSVSFESDSAYRDIKEGKFPSLWSLIVKNRWKQITIFHPIFSYRVRKFLTLICLLRIYKQRGGARAFACLKEYFRFYFNRVTGKMKSQEKYESLRKTTDSLITIQDDPGMVELRRGR